MAAKDLIAAGQGDLSDRVCFYCIGAQKTGSSWLHTYLSGLSDVHTPPVKELHYFDTLHLPRVHGDDAPGWVAAQADKLNKRIALLKKRRDRFVREERKAKVTRELECREKMLAALSSRDAYRDILTGDLGEAKVFGETTPSYALLDREVFAEMAGMFPNTRFIFVMRDPVNRLWSQMRMRTQRLDAAGVADEKAEARALMRFERALKTRRGWARSDYKHTIEELLAVVPARDVLFLFYETMFTEDEIRRVCDFLGADYVEPMFEEKVHIGRHLPLPAELAVRARAIMADVYDFIDDHFGEAVPTSWRQV